MNPETVALQLPASLYAQLQELALESDTEPVELIRSLVARAQMHRAWLSDLQQLREQIERDGGLQIGMSQDEVLEQLHKTRRELFGAEYAHLYR